MKKLRPAAERQRDTARLLQAALCCGVMALLRGADVVRVLGASSALRSDAGVVACAIRSITTDPRWLPPVRPPRRTGGEPVVAPEVVQLAWRLETFVAAFNGRRGTEIRPFAVMAPAAVDWTAAESVAEALTSTLPFERRVLPAALTVLETHWDQLGPSHHADAVACALCETAVASVCQYRDDVEAFVREFELTVVRNEAAWEAKGYAVSEIFEMSFDFQQRYFENEQFLNTYVANKDDAAVLRHICASGRFPAKVHALPDAVQVEMLSVNARETCRTVYQPLKRLLLTICESPIAHIATVTERSQSADVVGGAVRCCGGALQPRGCVLVGFVVPSILD